MSTWYNATQGVVEAANSAMAEIAASHSDDTDQRLQKIWRPVADALRDSIRDDLADNWSDEYELVVELASDFVGQTSDTGKIVSWGTDHGAWREFVIHENA